MFFTVKLIITPILFIYKKLNAYISRFLIRYLHKPVMGYLLYDNVYNQSLINSLQPGDVLLIEGNFRISIAIKYLTQSKWSHAALFLGSEAELVDKNGKPASFIEANSEDGVVGINSDQYRGFNVRICRPKYLQATDIKKMIKTMKGMIGIQYDMKNIIDLIRYTFPQPPVPHNWKRRMFSIGSGTPTKIICSALIAKAFHDIHYPILPKITRDNAKEIYHIQHTSLYMPIDFDMSPYFDIIKPQMDGAFNYKGIHWVENKTDEK